MAPNWFRVVKLVAIVVFAATARAQDTFQFHYQPPVEYHLSTTHGASGTLFLQGVPGVGEGQNLRFEALVGATDVTREALGEAVLIETIFDSVSARYESPVGGSWTALPVPYRPAGAVQKIRNRAFESTPLESSVDPFFLNAARGLRMMVEIPLPSGPVAVGTSWPVEFPFPFTSQIPSDSALLITVDLNARGTARLDSIVVRSLDTLAFVSLNASFDAVTLPSAYSYPTGDLPVTMTGTLAGSHIWSTGWYGWAGGLSTVTVDHVIEGLPSARMTTTLVTSTQVGL